MVNRKPNAAPIQQQPTWAPEKHHSFQARSDVLDVMISNNSLCVREQRTQQRRKNIKRERERERKKLERKTSAKNYATKLRLPDVQTRSISFRQRLSRVCVCVPVYSRRLVNAEDEVMPLENKNWMQLLKKSRGSSSSAPLCIRQSSPVYTRRSASLTLSYHTQLQFDFATAEIAPSRYTTDVWVACVRTVRFVRRFWLTRLLAICKFQMQEAAY